LRAQVAPHTATLFFNSVPFLLRDV